MSEEKKNGTLAKSSKWPIRFGLALIVVGPVLLLLVKDSHAGWAVMLAGLIFMAASRFEDVQEIALASFKMKLFERRVGEVEVSVRDMRRLAKENARLALASIQFAGRLSGFPEEFKSKVLADTRQLLTDLNVTASEIADVESLWHATVEFDYASWATGHNKVPVDLPELFHQRWKELKMGGIENRSTPQRIRTFFVDAGMLTPERDEILKDYEHYVLTRQHRRENLWRRRRDK